MNDKMPKLRGYLYDDIQNINKYIYILDITCSLRLLCLLEAFLH